MKAAISCCALLFLVLGGMPAEAQDSLVLYDGFDNVTFIDPGKWFGFEFGGSGRDAAREIDTSLGRLRLLYRAHGSVAFDTGFRTGSFGLSFPDPAAITTIEANVQVGQVEAMVCSTPGSNASEARVELTGRFFNTATPTPGSSLNDVFAIAAISRRSDSTDPDPVLRVIFFAGECSDDFCSTATSLGFIDVGPIAPGQTETLRLEWDQVNHRFVFQRGGGSLFTIPYEVSDIAPPSSQFKNLHIFTFAANCTAEPRPVAFMEAFLDDVFVNEPAAPVNP